MSERKQINIHFLAVGTALIIALVMVAAAVYEIHLLDCNNTASIGSQVDCARSPAQ